MNGLFKKFLAVPLTVLACASSVLLGCASEPESANNDSPAIITSYISAQTEVYSSTAEVVEAVADTVVEISTESVVTQWGHQYIVSGAGSGVIIGKSGEVYYIVTNNHVIDGANEIKVSTRSGESYSASLIATDDSADIAVVSVTSSAELKIAVWGDSDSLKVGEDLIAIGNPLGNLGGTVTKGILSAKGRTIATNNYAMTLLQTDTAINPGNSGGGLFNMRGELIGVVNAKASDEEIEGICFAIPANTARSVAEDLLQYGYIKGRATFNLTLSEGTLNSQSIVYVVNAEGAEEGTFKKYDRIYSINGKTINSVLDYNVALSAMTAGDTAQIQVYRGTVEQGMFGNSVIRFDENLTTFSAVSVQYK